MNTNMSRSRSRRSRLKGKMRSALSRPAVWQWILIVGVCSLANEASFFVDPNAFYVKLLYGAGTMFFAWALPAYFVKALRYNTDIWKGNGMIRRDMDSGAKQSARIYLAKERPAFLLAPLSHLFLKWVYKVGEIDLRSGSVSVTKIFVTNLVNEEKQCRAIGTNDRVSPEGSAHLMSMKDMNNDVVDTISGLLDSGLIISEV